MKRYLPLLILLNSYSGSAVATEQIKTKKTSHGIDFQYDDQVGERYLTLTILRNDKKIRTLRAKKQSGGAFEADDLPRLSPDRHFVFLSQIESDELETPNGPVMREVAYCNLIDVHNGCIVARDTGQFCGGTFTLDGKWKIPLYPEVDLVDETPTASDYANGKLRPTDSPNTSFDNLLACDPPNDNNADSYRVIIKRNLFGLDSAQREAFERNLKNGYFESRVKGGK